MTLEKAIQRAFDYSNLEGEETDIWGNMFRYKVIRELSDNKQEEIYNDIAERLGF